MGIIKDLQDRIKGHGLRIVFAEGYSQRVLSAAIRHQELGYIHPIVLGQPDVITVQAKEIGKNIGDLEIIDINNYPEIDKLVEDYVKRRNGKEDEETARKMLQNPNYFGTMLIYEGLADGMISGAVGSTADTIRPALKLIKTAPESKLVSGAMIMVGPENQEYVFADIAVNIMPTPEDLVYIAHDAAKFAEMFGIDPKVAMLSFSTKGSASSPEQQKMVEATKLAHKMYPRLPVDGELQFDAAVVPVIGARKAQGSKIAGHANVFVFPNLDAGNIGYKIGQHLGHYLALGPILLGLNAPINDLSRGCTEEDVFLTAIVTAAMALEHSLQDKPY